MNRRMSFPDVNRLSVLVAVILLAYTLTRFINIPPTNLLYTVVGIRLSFSVDVQFIITVLVSCLAAAGMDWLIHDHPTWEHHPAGWASRIQHLILPALSAWVISISLSNLQQGSGWWIFMTIGGILLLVIFIAEYQVIDVTDVRHPTATVLLTGLSFSLFLLLSIAVKSAGLRLYLTLPAMVFPLGLITLRTLYLRLGGLWSPAWSGVIALVVGQVAIALHYWPLSPIQYGLGLLAPAYGLTSIAAGILEKRSIAGLLVEPLVMAGIMLGLAIALA